MECVGHVQKRLGKKLRDLKKKTFVDDNGHVLNLRWGGKGRLTNTVIDSLTVFYGEAIRNFPGDVDGMYRAIWAVFHTLCLVMKNTTTSSAHQDLTHGASSIVHWLMMRNYPSTPLSSQWT